MIENPDKKLLVEQDVKKFVKKVIANLQAHFPEKPLLKAFEIFDPEKLPTENLATYGGDQVSFLCIKYAQIVDEDATQTEWESFKQNIKTNYLCHKMHKLLFFLVNTESMLHHYPNLAKLAQILFVLQL